MSQFAPQPDLQPAAGPCEVAGHSPKVMIVDDDPVTVDLVRSQLKSVGYRNFLVCTDPARAMELIHAEEPDVVLLDIIMPAVSGLEILREVRASAASAHVPVIILTAAGDTETKIQALELGATDFLSKPVNFVELTPRVRNALVIKAHQDHLRRYAQELEKQVAAQTAELKESYAALQRANEILQNSCAAAQAATRAKSEFLANMSHEIRTPLTAIIGFAEELLLDEDRCEPATERARMLHTIWVNGRHLLRVVNDILDMSIIERGGLVAERIPCSPVQIAGDVVRLLQVRADAKGLALSAELSGPIPEVIQTDPTRLQQILTNLVGNAIKFTESGSVRLVLRLLDGDGAPPRLQFEVTDTGIGIRREEMDRLFEPFVQADASTARRFGGTGLGLTICKHLVEKLGGTIGIESEPGVGSTFRATVATGPLEGVAMVESFDGSAAEAMGRAERGTGASPARRLDCRVLLAEDAPDNQRLISHILGKAGAEVSVVGDGQAAYDLAMKNWNAGKPFDVILTDIQMPVLNGYRLAQRLRQAGYGGRIIALTASVMADEQEKCICAGCDVHLGKPFSRDGLIEVVARHSNRELAATGATPAEVRAEQDSR